MASLSVEASKGTHGEALNETKSFITANNEEKVNANDVAADAPAHSSSMCSEEPDHVDGAGGSRRPSLSFLHQFDNVVGHADIPQFLSEHKQTLRFPEILLFLLVQAEREASKSGRPCIAWTLSGRAIVIRRKDELVNKILPIAFCQAKFSSFTRKLYRWGFRQVTSKSHHENICEADEKVFWHPYFRRDDKPLMVNMKSTTAEGTRRAMASKKLMVKQGHQEAKPPVLVVDVDDDDEEEEVPLKKPSRFFPFDLDEAPTTPLINHRLRPSLQQTMISSPALYLSSLQRDHLASQLSPTFLVSPDQVAPAFIGMPKTTGARFATRPIGPISRYMMGPRYTMQPTTSMAALGGDHFMPRIYSPTYLFPKPTSLHGLLHTSAGRLPNNGLYSLDEPTFFQRGSYSRR